MNILTKTFSAASIFCASFFFLTGCTSLAKKENAPAKVSTVKKLAKADDIFLPEKIYAVTGAECNIYFKNIFFAVNHANYVFDVDCPVGKQEEKRWTFIPMKKESDKSYPLTIKVYDEKGLVAEAATTVFVTSPDAGKGRNLSILVVGDSLTNATEYSKQLWALCKRDNAPLLKMIGSHAGSGKKVVPGGVAHEGYGGWTWGTFRTQYIKDPKNRLYNSYRAKSKFLIEKNGKIEFSLAEYVKEYNNGKMPDVITFQLGVNDIFGAKDGTLDARIKTTLDNADKLIALFRKEAPDALIGVGFVTSGANQDAFGNNYKCGQTSFGYYRNHFRLNQAMAKHFASRINSKFVMIPSNVNLDTENNFPAKAVRTNVQNTAKVVRQDNGVHPAASGYRQMGDSFYAWLKYLLANGGLAEAKK
ncbi:MAG: hypothetical protein J6S53_10705 [Lentisphaeria bacterium]|nr:hypothetical protein [Lentisphaeria bacterium]